MKVGIPDGEFGVHKTKKAQILELECSCTECFILIKNSERHVSLMIMIINRRNPKDE